jgi:hypothetical protein
VPQVVHELAAPVRFLAGWYEVLSLGVYPRLLRAIVSYPLLLRVCNSLTSPLNCRTRANPSPPNPLANTDVTLHPNFHSCIIFIPVSQSGTRTALSTPMRYSKLCHPDRSGRFFFRAAFWRAGHEVEGPRQPINRFTIRSAELRPLSPLPTHPLFLSSPFIFPLVEIPFSI